MYMILTCHIFPFVPSVSNLLKTELVLIMPLIGFENNIQTIMMEKICRVFPDIYAIMPCIGSCFAGPSAISHDFFNFSVSASSCVGGLRALPGLIFVFRLRILTQCSLGDLEYWKHFLASLAEGCSGQ